MVASLATFFPSQDVSAATIKKESCIGYDSVAYTSPFSKTSDMCLGQGQTYQYYQFVVKFPSKVSEASVSGKSGSGTSITFVKQDDTTYVSKAGGEFENMGYAAPKSTSSSTCNNKDKIYSIDITAKGNNKTQPFNINLCSYTKAEQSLVPEQVADKITGDDGTTAQTGTIYGKLGILRENALVPAKLKTGLLEQDGITSIKLSGKTNLEAKGAADWYTLSNGKLTIPKLASGTYKLDIVYNDAIILQGLGGDAGWTNGDMKLSYSNITVPAGGDVWIAGSEDSKPKYFNAAGDVATDADTQAQDRTTCVIEGIGWIICPVVNFMGGIVDGAYTFVGGLLVVQPLLTTGTGGEGLYNAWSAMRSIANIAFVIAFLIIIFSQLTSLGVSNYGVKKLLPRLVIAAILVNVSYWVCAVAVDLSNIAGASMVSIFEGIAGSIPDAKVATDALSTGDGWQGIIGKVLGGVGVVGILYYVGIAALLPALIAALVAIITVFLVLTLRQALIILLIVVSPLAFVAFLLPNTEDLFTKWRKLLTTLLLMYPIIAGLFGVSALASTIIMQSAKPGDVVVQIMGALISILPLALTPLVMKTAGGVLNRFGGVINNPNKGPFDRMRKGAEAIKKDQNNMRNRRALGGASQFGRGAFVRFGARRKGIAAGREGETNRANAEYLAGQAKTNDSFRNAAAGGSLTSEANGEASQRVLANAISAENKFEVDEVNASKIVIEDAQLSGSQRQELATTGSVTKDGKTYSGNTMQKAAIQEQMRTGGMGDIYQLVEASGGSLQKFSQTIAQGVAANGHAKKDPSLGGKTLDKIDQAKIGSPADLDNSIESGIREGKYTAESFAGMHNDARARVIRIAQDKASKGDPSLMVALRAAADGIRGSSEINGRVAGNTEANAQIESLVSPAASAPTGTPSVINAPPAANNSTGPVSPTNTATSVGSASGNGSPTRVRLDGSADHYQTVINNVGGIQNLSDHEVKIIHQAAEERSIAEDAASGRTAMTEVGLNALDEIERRGRP